MNFIQAIKSCLIKYGNFSGRASRSEIWYFYLFMLLLQLFMNVLQSLTGYPSYLFSESLMFLFVIPSFAVNSRRMHDLNHSGWWQLVFFIPVIGFIVMVIWYSTKGISRDNQYGTDPLKS